MKKTLDDWLTLIMNEKIHPNNDIIAYNFGLFKSDKGYCMYLIGSKSYDPEDSDWACDEDYTPKNKYVKLPENFDSQNWQELLETVVKELKSWTISEIFKKSFLYNAQAITTGFDEGDLIVIK